MRSPAPEWATSTGPNSGTGDGVSVDGSVNQANLDGTTPHGLASGQDSPWGVAVDANYLYWANQILVQPPETYRIWRANLDGSNPQAIDYSETLWHAAGLAVDANHLYWTSLGVGPTGARS